jgi:alkylation response protein AidB-like acyl-CoA dehydrogenase
MIATDAAAGLVRAARDLFPVLDAAWPEGDEQRRVPHEVVEQLRAAGLFRMLVPEALGGAQVDLISYTRVLELLGYANGAAGWDVAASSIGGLFSLGLPRPGIDRIYGNGPDVIFAGTVTTDRDAARAVVTEGGYRVSGRWRFGSGCQDADWMIASAWVFDGEQGRLQEGGAPDYIYTVFPRPSVQVLDTWHVLGMRGTGSHDWTVQDAFVPRELTERTSLIRGVVPLAWPGTLYRLPLASITALHFSAVALGLARRAIDALVDLAGFKTPHRAPGLLRERVQTQEAVARAEVVLESARAYRDRVVEEAWSSVERGGELTPEQRLRVRLGGSNAVESAARVTDLMYTAGGTTSIEDSFVLSRCFRDVHVIAQSVAVSPFYFEMAGRVFLGLEPGASLPY